MTDNNHQGNTPVIERLLTVGEVAALWQVDAKTVSRWSDSGWGDPIRTPGGHRRFRESSVRLPDGGLAESPVAARRADRVTPPGVGPAADSFRVDLPQRGDLPDCQEPLDDGGVTLVVVVGHAVFLSCSVRCSG